MSRLPRAMTTPSAAAPDSVFHKLGCEYLRTGVRVYVAVFTIGFSLIMFLTCSVWNHRRRT